MKIEEKKSIKIYKFLEENKLVPYILIGITLFVFSMLLTMQFKTVNNPYEMYEGKRESELIEELAKLNQKYNQLEKEYTESKKVVEEYEMNSTDRSELISSMRNQINSLSIIAGVSDVKGEGIVITLEDGDVAMQNSTRTDTLVHDSDILTVVNELFVGGAEAVSVNGERIIATTQVRCVGSVININDSRVASPFVIKAIGNSQHLESAINIKNGVKDLLSNLGIKVNVERKTDITVEKYSGNISFMYAK